LSFIEYANSKRLEWGWDNEQNDFIQWNEVSSFIISEYLIWLIIKY
jgi:hypothetical protein